MQEQITTAPLRVWPFALATSAAAIILGILAIPIHFVKHMAMARHFEHFRVDRMPGGPGPAVPVPPGVPAGPEVHGAWLAAHIGLGIEWAIVGLIVLAVYAGVAGAVLAAVYNALASRRA